MSKRFIIIVVGVLLFVFCSRQENTNRQILPKDQDSPVNLYYKKGVKFEKNNKNDSAYYYLQLAEKNAGVQTDSFLLSKIFFLKAVIDYKNRDLPMAENNSIEALKYLPQTNSYYKTYIYNLLGLIAKEKRDYPIAIQYFRKARNAYKKLEDTLSIYIAFRNNISNVYREKGDYTAALPHLDSILSLPEIKNQMPEKYARTLDNKAHILLKTNQMDEAKKLLDSAFQIRKNIHDRLGIIQSHLNYSEFYQKSGKSGLAQQHALTALKLSGENNIPENKLESYKNLIKINLGVKDNYFNKYLKLNDSILFEQQKAKEQTARIRFESAEKEKQIEKQKQLIIQKNIKNTWLSIVLLLVSVALFIFALQVYKIRKQNKIITAQNKQLNRQNFLIENFYKDMHHRIKNNLNIINYSFVEPIVESVEDPEILSKLQDLQNKILSFKNLHLLLMDNKWNIDVPLHDYADLVMKHIWSSLPEKSIKIVNDIDKNIKISYKQAFPIVLIINEFITNSYKYAFDSTQNPLISISATETNGYIKLVLKDNGKGLPEGMTVPHQKSQGLKLIYSLVEELRGKLKHNNKNGLEFIITFLKKTD